jgi:hypothetical protein
VLAFESSADRRITGLQKALTKRLQKALTKNGSMFFLRSASRKRASRTWYGATTKQEMRLKGKGKIPGAFSPVTRQRFSTAPWTYFKCSLVS